MTKEEFSKKRKELEEKLYNLQEEYIKSNSPIPQGTKVKVTRGNEVKYGFIESYYLVRDNLKPSVLVMKKDGTPSTMKHMYIPYDAVIEVCD